MLTARSDDTPHESQTPHKSNCETQVWNQREELRHAYESVHGNNLTTWPARHAGLVQDAVPSMAHVACLGCHWFDATGHDMRDCLLEAIENGDATKSQMAHTAATT